LGNDFLDIKLYKEICKPTDHTYNQMLQCIRESSNSSILIRTHEQEKSELERSVIVEYNVNISHTVMNFVKAKYVASL